MCIHLLIHFSLIKWIHARLVSVMVSIPVILQITSKNFPLHLDLCHRLPLLPLKKGMGAPWRRRSCCNSLLPSCACADTCRFIQACRSIRGNRVLVVSARL